MVRQAFAYIDVSLFSDILFQKSLQRCGNVLAEEFHYEPCAESCNDCTFPRSHQLVEKQERENHCHHNTADVKGDFHIAEFLVNGIR